MIQTGANKIMLIILLILLVGWQYWSWGPYDIRLDENLPETNKDFLLECRYAMKGLHSNTGFSSGPFLLRPGEAVTCPRRFLGPFGIGMSAWVYHPLYVQQWVHRRSKIDTSVAVLSPNTINAELEAQTSKKGLKTTMVRHWSMLEHKYLPVFSKEERQVLADRYVKRLQDHVRIAGGMYGDSYDEKTLKSVDKTFRNAK